ncbi:unnamed protein product [Lampetra fluviatilis]
MGVCERGVQTLLTTGGAFAAFGLMSIAVGTDFWLYSRGNCRSKGGGGENDTSRKNEEVLTHSGLWRTCCLEGSLKGRCKKIDHFPEDADFDSAEYLMRVVRASSVFPILSVALLLFGGLCIAASRFYKSKNNIVLSAGIFFVSAGLSNIIGIIVYISANVGDPNQSQSKKNNYSYGWSFYFGALSFVVAEMVGVLAVRIYIDNHRLERARFRPDFLRKSAASSSSAAAAAAARVPAAYVYRYRRRSRSPSRSRSRSRSSSRSSEAPLSSLHQQQQQQQLHQQQQQGAGGAAGMNVGGEGGFVQHSHNCVHKEMQDTLTSTITNRRTTPV